MRQKLTLLAVVAAITMATAIPYVAYASETPPTSAPAEPIDQSESLLLADWQGCVAQWACGISDPISEQ